MDGVRTADPREDDVTEPGTPSDVPEADRAEQEALLDPPGVAVAGEATPPRRAFPRPTPSTSSCPPGRGRPAARRGRSATARPTRPTSSSRSVDVPLDEDDADLT